MKRLLCALLLAVSCIAAAQQELPNLVVEVDGKAADLKPVMLELNEYLVPLRDAVALFTGGKAQLGIEEKKAFTISADGHVLVRIPMEKAGTEALVYAPGSTEPIRRLKMDDFPRQVNAKGRGPTTMIMLELLAACLGITVDVDGKRLALFTPEYWCTRVGIKPELAQNRLAKNIALLPDFGVSPPAKTILFWVRPPVESFVQSFRVTDDAVTPMLGINQLDDEVDILAPNDRAKARASDPVSPIRAETYNYGTEVGKVQNYVSIVLRKDSGFEDPVKLINSGAVADGDWAIIGVRQRVGRMPILFENRLVKQGEDIGTFAENNKTTASLIRILNGLRAGEKLKPGSKLTVMVGIDEAALAKMQAADYKITGLYEVQPGETVKELAEEWGVSEEDILAANATITPGGEPEPGDLINVVAPKATKPPPQVQEEIAKNEAVTFMGTAVTTGSVALRQTSTSGSSPLSQLKANTFVEIVGYMPEKKMYRVRIDDAIGYVPEGALRIRGGGAVAMNLDPNNNIVAREALKYIGTPYVWGGNGLTTGIDCSHFVAQIYQRIGWKPVPPAPVLTQERIGSIVHFKPGPARRAGQTIFLPNPVLARGATSDLRSIQAGDRLIFQRGNTDASGTRHTAVYIGKVPKAWQARFGDIPWAFVHASSSRGVTVNSLTQKYYWNLYKFTVRSSRATALNDTDDLVASQGGK